MVLGLALDDSVNDSELSPPAGLSPVGDLRSDRDFVASLRAGEESAFEKFSETYLPLMYRFVLGRVKGDQELTRDLVQAAVVKVLRRLDSYRGEASFATWLCACCRNEIAMHFRTRGRRPDEVDLDAEASVGGQVVGVIGPGARNPELETLRLEQRERVHLALGQLPGKQARALVLRYLEGGGVPEVASGLGLGYKAAESLLSRARRAFEKAYRSLPGGSEARPGLEWDHG